MKTYVFCGQGSQTVGMGKEYFAEFPDLVKKADEILGYSIEELCLEDPNGNLNLTQYTQPALYVVSMLEYYQKVKEGNKPDFLIGHSIGEYSALCAAGVYSFEDGLRIVQERGRLMSEAQGGGMAAVLGIDAEQIREVLTTCHLESIDIGNYNSTKQTVISGKVDDVKNAQQYFLDYGARSVIPLKVSGAFHSRYMEPAKKQLEQYIMNISFSSMEIPVISNYTARPYEDGKIKNTLLPQISNPVRWVETVRYLMRYEDMEFEKIGPGAITINLVNKILKEVGPLSEQEANKQTIEVAYDVVETPIQLEKQFSFEGVSMNARYLGDMEFSKRYQTKYNYVIGGMCNGIAGVQLVSSACNHGILSFLGTTGLAISKVEQMIQETRQNTNSDTLFGINITQDYFQTDRQRELFELCKRQEVPVVEISGFMSPTKELVLYKAKGLRLDDNHKVQGNAIIAKISNSLTAKEFLSPAPVEILDQLREESLITTEEYELAKKVPVVDDICIVGDCAYETDRGNLISILPEVLEMRQKIMSSHALLQQARVGVAGGIGSKRAAVAMFLMGADFILTGSVNECTKEANLPNGVKDMLAEITVNDVTYVPSERLFELNKLVQVVKKGIFFPSRANILKSVYDVTDSVEAIPESMKVYIEHKILRTDFTTFYQQIEQDLDDVQLKLAQSNEKYKMALVFKRYLRDSFQRTLQGNDDANEIVDYEIYCSAALGSLNEQLSGTPLEQWNLRTVSDIADFIMNGAYEIVTNKQLRGGE